VRSKRVIAGRRVGGTYTLPEHRKAYGDDFGGESDALSVKNTVSRAKNYKGTHT